MKTVSVKVLLQKERDTERLIDFRELAHKIVEAGKFQSAELAC